MLQALIPSFVDELTKVGAKSIAKKVKDHFAADRPNWDAFEKSLRSPRFTAEVVKNPEADPKLQAYTKANNAYLRSKDVVSVIPSGSSGKSYSIKKLPDGRLACGCRDWQYRCSWEGTECRHIKAAKKGIEKLSFATMMARGAGLAWHMDRARAQAEKGRQIRGVVRAARHARG
jgi:hypothetical protein